MGLFSGKLTYNIIKDSAIISKQSPKNGGKYIFNHYFRYHPHFKNVMQSRISQLMGIDYKFDLMLSEDGSGRGAALVAATLKSEKRQSKT